MKHVKNNHPLVSPSLINWFFDDVLTKDAFNAGSKAHSVVSALNRPGANIIENETDFTLQIAAPGLNKEDFSLDLDENKLSISAQVNTEVSENKQNFKSREFNYSSFKRSFVLPKQIDAENISAEYTNGILSVVIPKKEHDKKASQIKVK